MHLAFTPPGMPAFAFYATTTPSNYSNSSGSGGNGGNVLGLAVGLGNGPVGFSTTTACPTVAGISSLLAAARAAEEALLVKTFGADRAGEGQAVKASAMWTLVSTPAENGGAPLLPVSRVWSFAPSPINDDFTYVRHLSASDSLARRSALGACAPLYSIASTVAHARIALWLVGHFRVGQLVCDAARGVRRSVRRKHSCSLRVHKWGRGRQRT